MSMIGLWWVAAKRMVGARTLYEVIALAALIVFYEGIPGVAWLGHRVPIVGAYLYLAEGRVPRSYYAGVTDERLRWEAARLKWEEAKRQEINQVSKDYSVAMMRLSTEKLQLTGVLEATQKDLDDEKAKHETSGDAKPYCPPAVPSRLRNYLNSIR